MTTAVKTGAAFTAFFILYKMVPFEDKAWLHLASWVGVGLLSMYFSHRQKEFQNERNFQVWQQSNFPSLVDDKKCSCGFPLARKF